MKKLILLLLLFFGLINNSIAQEKSFEKLVTIGISQPILNNGTGFHIGFNPSFELTNSFSLEGQLSHIYTNIDSYFLSGDYGRSNDVNLLAGGRFYLNSSENKNRFFVNLLLGLNYERDDRLDREIREEYRLGFSVGGYYRFKKINFGLTYDSHHIVLKCGYSF
tara:strand:+ start:106 stop:597 length:492 start_codon:yes stop_codon:yes gene_type:complete